MMMYDESYHISTLATRLARSRHRVMIMGSSCQGISHRLIASLSERHDIADPNGTDIFQGGFLPEFKVQLSSASEIEIRVSR